MATLQLYLIRHGIAAERGEEYPDDSKRPLTSHGIARLRREAKGLEALGVTFAEIVSSPLVRTRQTADVLAASMKSKPAIVTSDALAPAGTPGAEKQEISKRARNASIALVGHAPTLCVLGASL
jgi:phosphohistidine phosphatase